MIEKKKFRLRVNYDSKRLKYEFKTLEECYAQIADFHSRNFDFSWVIEFSNCFFNDCARIDRIAAGQSFNWR